MGRVNGREQAPYENHHLTNHPLPDIQHSLLPQAEIRRPRFRVSPLPPQYAKLFQEYPGMYFPVCTWDKCADHAFMTPDFKKIPGNFLMLTSITAEDEAQGFLLDHLLHSHGLKQVIVEPYEPYGYIWAKDLRVWK